MKSFKEASEELRITKQTLTSWIEELNESNNIIWKNKTRYLDEKLINKIKLYKDIEIKSAPYSDRKNDRVNDEQNLKLLEILKKENDLLIKQLKIKDEQIKDLTRLIDQQQQLTISDKKEKEELKNEIKMGLHQSEYKKSNINYHKFEQQDNSQYNAQNHKNESDQKRGFWSKLFGK
ncbi:DUF536 domain-containing protein [Clostridium botulinum]|uniref:DUF536 domain-containing protein n=1 Tax=Clostridium botulinum TaxID=1491 RepID=UPI00217E9B45|nr:DUF536 domain-containing protein [Clostridium botulinum]MCS6112729.1 DUF536 domain-containing protein [Clostridium botulinum]MCS6168288.1 DUF536 domain-containing protein [Clostridium botulinum]